MKLICAVCGKTMLTDKYKHTITVQPCCDTTATSKKLCALKQLLADEKVRELAGQLQNINKGTGVE